MPLIWLVEDDEDIREIALYALQSAGYNTLGFESGTQMFAQLQDSAATVPDLLILDIMLPGMDGLEILRRLRAQARFATLPILMLTAKSAEYDKVKGLDAGADDYMTKPYGVMELISRIKALLRRANATPVLQPLTFQEITLNPTTRSVTVHLAPIALTFKEYELLHCLLRNARIVLKREKILDAVWGYSYEGESRTLDMHIKSLRKKLGEAAVWIKTIRGVGYVIKE